MFSKLSKLIDRITGRSNRRFKSDADKKLWQLIEDLRNPIEIQWNLTESDHKILTKYVEMFIRDKEVDTSRMKVSPDIYPSLHRFIVALQGDCPWQETMAAFDYLEDRWPELKPLLDEA